MYNSKTDSADDYIGGFMRNNGTDGRLWFEATPAYMDRPMSACRLRAVFPMVGLPWVKGVYKGVYVHGPRNRETLCFLLIPCWFLMNLCAHLISIPAHLKCLKSGTVRPFNSPFNSHAPPIN